MEDDPLADDDPAEEEMEEPPSSDNPMNMISTLICSHCRKVRSLAKKVLGSTLVLTSRLALHNSTGLF